MAEPIQNNASFWQGIAAGFLAGVAVAAALRYTRFEKFLTGLSTVEGKLDGKLASLEERLNPSPASTAATFSSRRDHPESAGDPRSLASDRTGATAEFTRRGGAPGGLDQPEILDKPGRPGETLDHTDHSKPVRPHSRSLDLGSAG